MTDAHERVGFAYRPALDGIRALAVIAVIGYHLDGDVIPGGFLGVDVFFVLSGYLIAGLLLAERERTERVNLLAFWLRRAKRLLPALFGVLLVVAAYGRFWAPKTTLNRLRWDFVLTFVYSANWRFATSGQSYFASNTLESPLKHAWSLAVEEQFYVFFPLLAMACFALARNRARALGIAAGLGAVGSAVMMSAFVDYDDPSFVYYATHTRAQELLIGVALACWAARRGSRHAQDERSAPRAVGLQLVGWAALTAVLVACFAIQDSDDFMYRGGYFAVGIVVAILVTCAVPRGALQSALSVKPLKWIGQRSYGLYLWHWPAIIALDPVRTDLRGWQLAGFRLIVTVAIAAFSYRFIEQPIRLRPTTDVRFNWPATRRITFRSALSSLVVVGIAFGATAGARQPNPALEGLGANPGPIGLVTDDPSTGVPGDPAGPGAADPGGPDGPPATGNPDDATSGDVYQPNLVAVIGDSVATTALPGLVNEARFRGYHLVNFTVPGCGVATDLVADPDGNLVKWSPQCNDVVTKGLGNLVDTWNADLFVWWSGWEDADRLVDGTILKVGTDEWKRDLDRQMEERLAVITARGAHVVLVDSAPKAESPIAEADRDPEGRHAALRERLLALADRHPDIVAVARFSDVLCPTGVPCPREIDGIVPRPDDGGHFTDATAAWAGSKLWPLLEAAWEGFPVESPNATARND